MTKTKGVMKNNYKIIELTIPKLLKFMQYEAEKHGNNIRTVLFNFTPKFTQYCMFGNEPEEVPEGEDLKALKEIVNIDETTLIQAIRASISRRYLIDVGYYPSVKKEHRNAEYDLFVSLSSDGYQEAIYINPDILNEELGEQEKESDIYYKEKSQGGKNRHKKTSKIKDEIIAYLFNQVGGKTIKQKSDKIIELLFEAYDDKDKPNKLSNFVKKFNLELKTLEEARQYFNEDKSERIYKWCLEFTK